MQHFDPNQESSTADTAIEAPALAPQPVKVKKKPGRKPNPASPALRKAQNRAAQRAFRERKELHMKELEVNNKDIREERDKLNYENGRLKDENEQLSTENWYLKGIVLSLQFVCLQHNMVIPQHHPYINTQTLSALAQSFPASILSYLNINAKNNQKLPSKHAKQCMPDVAPGHSTHSTTTTFKPPLIMVTQDNIQSTQQNYQWKENAWCPQNDNHLSSYPPDDLFPSRRESMPELSPMSLSNHYTNQQNAFNRTPIYSRLQDTHHPTQPRGEPAANSHIAAAQTLQLRMHLQSAYNHMDSIPSSNPPTALQMAIPHDPRIDLIPTAHMRDRMILYRGQFDLDDCCRCLLSGSVFHGGDPAIAGNWELCPEFYEKYWFLTVNYDLQRYSNKWNNMQDLDDIDTSISSMPSTNMTPSSRLSTDDLPGYMGVSFNPEMGNPSNSPQPIRNDSMAPHGSHGYNLASQCKVDRDRWGHIKPKSYETFLSDVHHDYSS
ncbi:hypothetical protein BDB01DRAFT_802604 [Pilobolus umbonatus]|nr:hypothetical protein BDB01DRAFT_802604 [Pilobolus umbonatus]